MSEKAADIIPDENTHLLDELGNLLEKQIELAHQGSISGVERLSKEAGPLIGKIAQTGILKLLEFKSRRNHLQKLYQELCLAITAQKAAIDEKLSQVRKGRKTIKTYRRNI